MLKISTLAAIFLGFALSSCASKAKPSDTPFPSGINHSPWTSLLKTYVDDKGLVDYAGLKANETDLAKLDSYLASFNNSESDKATGDELTASATNAYNAFAIRSIIANYPTKSIRDIDGVFSEKSHSIGGQKLSLDEIEKGNVIPTYGAEGHAIVVCCAISCPPLQNEAYTAENLDTLAAKASTEWLSRKKLNDFTSSKKIKISKIFDWYKDDFASTGGVKAYLKKYAPEKYTVNINSASISYLEYDWALNSQ